MRRERTLPWSGIVLGLLGLATLWLAWRGREGSGEDTEVGLLAMLPDTVWRAFFGILGVALLALGTGTLL